MVGNIRRCRKHVRAIDLSPPCPGPGAPDLLYPSPPWVPVAFGTPDFGVATERGAPATERSTNSQERERANEGRWKSGGVGRRRGSTVGGGYPSRYLNLRLPRGRAQKCKAIVSRPRPVSSSAGSLLYPRKGVTYRDTRESTEGLDISRRSVAVVAAWFRARFTARERTTYGIPVEVRWLYLLLLLPLSRSLSFSVGSPCVVSTLFIPPIPNNLLLLPAKRISRRRGFTAREISTTIIRLRTLLPVTR